MTLLERGESFAGRTVVAYLGRGGSGEVYLAEDAEQGSLALKVLFPSVALRPAAVARFRRECEIAEAVHHPHVARAYGHGVARARGGGEVLYWSALEYFDGGSARQHVPARRRPPDLPLVVPLLGQVATGLDHLHELDLIHRDVKPSNILLQRGLPPRAVVSDFGLARFVDEARPLARNGRVEGSVAYAPPELLMAHRLSVTTDVYQFACTATELLTGEPPFPRATMFDIVHAHLSSPPPSLHRRQRSLPVAIDGVIGRALAKDPRVRPGSCGAFVGELAHALDREMLLTPGR